MATEAIDSPDRHEGTSWFGVLKRTVREFKEDNLTDWAAALTYYGDPGDLPRAAGAGVVVGLVGKSATAAADRQHRHGRARPGEGHRHQRDPEPADDQGAAGILFVVGMLGALWSASGYVGAFIARVQRDLRGRRGPADLEDAARCRSASRS